MTKNNTKPDGRSNNVNKQEKAKNNMIGEMEASKELMLFEGGTELDAIRRRNAREEAINGFRKEILDEALARKNGYTQE